MAIHKLSATKVKTAPAGKYEDGGGLRLVVSESLSRRWVQRFTINGKRREMGLGSYPLVSLSEARNYSKHYRKLAKSGIDPIYNRIQEDKKIPTFTSCAAMLIRSKRRGWKNRKHAKQWINTLRTYAIPVLGSRPVNTITVDDVLAVLNPIWTVKTETASRVRSRIENVMGYATAMKWRTGENPAQWRGNLDKLLDSPKKLKKVTHHPALPYEQLPQFYSSICDSTSLSCKALRLAILTATRTGEVLGSQWAEIDIAGKVWVIPAVRMKAEKEHRVPLSDEAISLLITIPRIGNSPFVFPSNKGKPLSSMALLQFMRKRGYGLNGVNGKAVPHGFRSTFRDWASEESDFPRDVAEMALAHTIKSDVEKAYRRGDLFRKRAEMMQAWADYATQASGNC